MQGKKKFKVEIQKVKFKQLTTGQNEKGRHDMPLPYMVEAAGLLISNFD